MEASNRSIPRPRGGNALRLPIVALCLLGGLIGVRIVQLAADSEVASDEAAPQAETRLVANKPVASGRIPSSTDSLVGVEPSVEPSVEATNNDTEWAKIYAACPHALPAMPAEVQTRLVPPHRLTAAKEKDPNWLVDPDDWYVPEDESKGKNATDSAPKQQEPKKKAPEQPPAKKPAQKPAEGMPAPKASDTKKPAPKPTPQSPAEQEELPAPPIKKPAPEISPADQAPPRQEVPAKQPAGPSLGAPMKQPAKQPQQSDPELPMPELIEPPVDKLPQPPAPQKPAPQKPEELLPKPPANQPPANQPAVEKPAPKPQPKRDASPKLSTPPAELKIRTPSASDPFRPFESPKLEPSDDITPYPATPYPQLKQPPRQPEPAPASTTPNDYRPESAPSQPSDSLFAAPPVAPSPAVNVPASQDLTHGAPHPVSSQPLSPQLQREADLAHRDLFAKNCYPSAAECGKCHKKLYDEWKISSHAYAFVSPMFQKFEKKISQLSHGTVGYFCYRCHSPVSTAMGIDRTTPLWDQPPVAREGVTCIACHRVNEQYGKANGERRIVPGDIHAPVYGGVGGSGVAEVIARKSEFKVKTSPDEKGAGQPIHLEGRFFEQLTKAEFCTSCHQVAVHPGIKLEVVWEQYRRSPACAKGVTCQDCHMGLKPGEASGYEITSIAEVNCKSVNNQRKHANHIFYGPNYSIAHPGVFPFHEKATRWKMQEWLQFDWRAGWGTDKFEDAVADGLIYANFPPVWKESDDRCDARDIIDDNLKLIGRKREVREEVMSHSLQIKGPFFKQNPRRGQDIQLHYDVTNLNEGHNVLTASLGAQPQLWANVVLISPSGQRLWETGYTDSDGDVCDIHSVDVRNKRMPFDSQLFNLQTMFLITGATGTDRELPLPVNVDIDQLPFLRPGAIPISVTNHPPFIRMESRSIAPLGTKRVKYRIPGELLRERGRYRLSIRMRNRIEPIYFMRFCEATDEMVRSMNEGILDINPQSVEFFVE